MAGASDLPARTDDDPPHGVIDDPTLTDYFATGYGEDDPSSGTRKDSRAQRVRVLSARGGPGRQGRRASSGSCGRGRVGQCNA